MASASGREGQPVDGGKVATWLSKVFQLNPAGLNWPRGVLFLDVMLVPLVVFWAIGHEEYLLSALFGALLAVVADPGGGFGSRASRIAVFALIGAGLTALGFGIGGDAWGWLVLAAFAVTLAAAWRSRSGCAGSSRPCCSTSGSSSPSGSRSASIIRPASPATPGLRCSPGPGDGAVDRGDVHRVAGPRAPGPAAAGRGDTR